MKCLSLFKCALLEYRKTSINVTDTLSSHKHLTFSTTLGQAFKKLTLNDFSNNWFKIKKRWVYLSWKLSTVVNSLNFIKLI